MKSNVIQPLQARVLGWYWLRICLAAIAFALTFALTFFLADAALALSDALRDKTRLLTAAAALLLVVIGALQLRRFTAGKIARHFESHDASLGNRLTNALQLSEVTGSTAIEQCLRQEAIALGRIAAADQKAWPVMRRGILLSLGFFGAAILGWIILITAGGDIYRSVLPRFTDPYGDHPPFSRLKIEVTPKLSEVLYGGQLEIRATTRGRPVDKLWLVTQSGTNSTQAIMFLAPDKSFFQTLANLREPTEFFVTDGQARSFRHAIKIRNTPKITLAEVTFSFPQYTGKSPQTTKVSDQPQPLPMDTGVQFRIVSNRPLKSGKLTLTPVLGGKPMEIPLSQAGQENVVSGEFRFAEAVLFDLTVVDIDGLSSQDPRQGRFNLLPDERPRLYVLEPGRDAVATPDTRVPIRVQAQDDYGISRVVWLRSHNGSIERPFTMKPTLKDGARSVEAVTMLDLPALGIYPGDVIEYYFEAADNYPKGPNVALSKMYRLEIISTEQYQRILRQQAARKALFESYFKTSNWLRRIAESARKLNDLAQTGASPETMNKELEALNKQLSDYENALNDLLNQAPMFDIESLFHATLAADRQAVSNLQRRISESLHKTGLTAEQVRQLSAELSEMTKEQDENISEPAQQIAAVTRLLANADKFTKLAQEEAALSRLLRRFQEKDSLSRLEQMEVQELAHQQRRIQTELQELLASLPALLEQLPDDPKFDGLRSDVTSFVNAVREAAIEEDLNNASKSLGVGDAINGYSLATSAAEKMEQLIARCNSMNGTAKQCLQFQPAVQQAMGNTLEQILAAMGIGNGGDSGDGYSMFNDQMALYGPGMEAHGEQSGGAQEHSSGTAFHSEQLASDAHDDELKAPETPGRVRLQPNAKFPLRYRDLVGEYFRVIAESLEGEVK